MPRAIWKGSISFGLVQVPVGLYSAESRTDVSLQLVDSRNNRRIRYQRLNEETGKEVPWSAIVKGYEYEDGKCCCRRKK
ncbi:MAG TPA: Ku protein [Verrucomicrobiales bacterium]|nr:Ku protein [Verrucomicrobiales bacterium]